MVYKHIIIGLCLLYTCFGFKFEVTRTIKSTESIDEILWSTVELTGDCKTNINFHVKVPKLSGNGVPEVSIYFANEVKNILQVDLSDNVKGIYYITPYNKNKNMEREDIRISENSDSTEYYGSFPGSWLPENCSKISATIFGDTIYNFYGLQNYQISILDLMNVEEYENFSCDSL